MDGEIDAHLKGRIVAGAYKDGECLIIQCSDGHNVRIGWVDGNGERVKGEPVFRGQGVRVSLPGINLVGVASGI